MEFDWGTIIGAVIGLVAGIAGSFYLGFRKAAQEDGVADYKDTVVEGVDKLVDELNKGTDEKPVA
jgi:hypothetical protein